MQLAGDRPDWEERWLRRSLKYVLFYCITKPESDPKNILHFVSIRFSLPINI